MRFKLNFSKKFFFVEFIKAVFYHETLIKDKICGIGFDGTRRDKILIIIPFSRQLKETGFKI